MVLSSHLNIWHHIIPTRIIKNFLILVLSYNLNCYFLTNILVLYNFLILRSEFRNPSFQDLSSHMCTTSQLSRAFVWPPPYWLSPVLHMGKLRGAPCLLRSPCKAEAEVEFTHRLLVSKALDVYLIKTNTTQVLANHYSNQTNIPAKIIKIMEADLKISTHSIAS